MAVSTRATSPGEMAGSTAMMADRASSSETSLQQTVNGSTVVHVEFYSYTGYGGTFYSHHIVCAH